MTLIGMRTCVAAMALVMACVAPAMAVQPDEVLSDPVLEQRARALSAGLRCLVCQNQSIDDSDAELARDLRLLVRERLTAGDSDTDVVDHVVARYGEFVLLRPRFGWHTVVLWLGPFVLLGMVSLWLGMMWRRQRRMGAPVMGDATGHASIAPLSEDEEARLAPLLDDDRAD